MMSKPKKPDKPKLPQSALDTKTIRPPDETSRAYASLISTTPSGLERKADTRKKSLLGGVA